MTDVTMVAYGDEPLHVYHAGDPAADMVYTVAIGANLDAVMRTVTPEAYEKVKATLDGVVSIVDHRTE